ncbi:MAG: hypothetical protein CSA97_01510 [Bacteroidetes bacterium]|nr:MAG: hypothetical protein CSA97_01510 [Bacteroidota bacterium]
MKMYLELKDETSAKFWEVEVNGMRQTIRYGKIGSLGTLKTTDFPDGEKAEKDAQRLIRSKMRKGYVEAEAPEGTDTAVAKREKMKAVASAGISAVVDDLLKGTGRTYSIKEGTKSSALRVLVNEDREGSFIEVNLPHETFMKRSDKLLPTIEVAKRMTEEVPRITALGKKPFDWGWDEFRDTRDHYGSWAVVDDFMTAQFDSYSKTTLWQGEQEGVAEVDFAAVEALLKAAGFEPDGDWDGRVYRIPGKKWDLNFYEGGLIRVRHSLAFDYEVGVWRARNSYPTLEGFRAYIEGFLDFHNEAVDAWEAHQEDLKRRWEVAKSTIEEQLSPSGYPRTFELWNECYDRQLLLHVELKRGKVLTLAYTLDEFEAEAEHLLSNAQRVASAMQESPLQFKVIDILPDRNRDLTNRYEHVVWKVAE